ncbi:hypothetical protein DFH27DRAFT_312344 [Peziza echinospora]|nr:hypothetical protein DFH27DRAFT_312344 [Peziza echinospora]
MHGTARSSIKHEASFSFELLIRNTPVLFFQVVLEGVIYFFTEVGTVLYEYYSTNFPSYLRGANLAAHNTGKENDHHRQFLIALQPYFSITFTSGWLGVSPSSLLLLKLGVRRKQSTGGYISVAMAGGFHFHSNIYIFFFLLSSSLFVLVWGKRNFLPFF